MVIMQQPNVVTSFLVEIEFEGLIYEASCAIIKLNTPDLYRCQLFYYDTLPQPFGIYHSDYVPEMLTDAKNRLKELLQELPKGRRIPKG